MKLGVIGWYGHYNFGDERILFCIKKSFRDHDLIITKGWNDARDRINEINKCDYILIGGGGLILRNIYHHTDVIRELKRPFAFVGVSVEAKHNKMKEFLGIIKEKAEFILVRDKKSKEYLDNHFKVIIGPDLTFLFPFDIVKQREEDVCGLNLRDWFYWKAQLHGYYHNLMEKAESKISFLKKIYPLKNWDPDKAVHIILKNFQHVLPIPFYFETNVINDNYVLSRYFNEVSTFFNINLYNEIKYLIGMRYHSIIFAVQCGIPFISLSYQPKNDRFCSDIGLRKMSIDIFNLAELENKIDYIKENYQQIREIIISYREKAIREIKYIFRSISHLIK